ncbi:MAG: hypothetical protein IV108_06605 [Burkholderiales bacterium]|nr:hypothetical protein [Burkholderiales bacterium]
MSAPPKIQFDKLPILDISGNRVGELSGEFDADQLGKYLVSEWVPYVECHRKCSRSDTCKFAVPVPGQAGRYEEIRCGVKSTVIKNFINLSFSVLGNCDKEQQEKLLGGAYYLSEFAFDAEFQIGMLINEHTIKWLGEYAPQFFARLVHLRETLNSAGQMLAYVPNLYDRKPVLLVEGKSEKAFLDKLRESNISWFTDLRVEVYGGSGNKHPRRIEMRLAKYIEDGYVCFMQGDKDGKERDQFQKLINHGVVAKQNIFQFDFDFETAVPPRLLLTALNNMGYLEDIDKDDFVSKIDRSKSARQLLIENYGLNIDPLKMELADEIGWIMSDRRFHWFQDKSQFMEKTELGQFLQFAIKMH